MLFSAWLSTSRSPMDRASVDRPPAPVEGLRNATREHGQLRLVAQRHGQLVSCSERFEGRHGEVGVPLGLGTATQEPEQPRHPALRGADRLRRRVRLRVELERPTACRESRVGLVGEVALVREAFVEGGGLLPVEDLGEAQREPVLAGGLPVRAQTTGVAGGSDRVADGVLLLPGPGRVVGQPVVVGATQPDQGSQGGGVPAGARAGGEARLDRLAGDLVPEREPRSTLVGHEHPVIDALVHRLGRLTGDLAEQPERRAGAEDRGSAQDVPGGRRQGGQPGQHRVAHRRGRIQGAGGQHLRDEERVPIGPSVERAGVEPGPRVRDQGGDRVRAEQRQVHPVDGGRGGEIAEQRRERVARSDLVVAEGHDGEQGHPFQSASEEPDQLQRRLVRPVHVLEEQHGGAVGQPRADLPEQPGTGPGGRHLDAVGELRQRVDDRTERCRGCHVVAEPTPHRDVLADPGGQQPDERGLADSGLPAEEHQPPGAGVRVRHPLEQGGEEGVTLDEHVTHLTIASLGMRHLLTTLEPAPGAWSGGGGWSASQSRAAASTGGG